MRPVLLVPDVADIAIGSKIDDGTKASHPSHLRGFTRLGRHCGTGRGANIGAAVVLGTNGTVQNYAPGHRLAVVKVRAIVGPAVGSANDHFARAGSLDVSVRSSDDRGPVSVTEREDVSIRGGSVCVAPVQTGRALVAAGPVDAERMPDWERVVGLPTRPIRWVGREGLEDEAHGTDQWRCPTTVATFPEIGRRSDQATEHLSLRTEPIRADSVRFIVVAFATIDLPLDLEFALKGHDIFGADVNTTPLATVSAGRKPLADEANTGKEIDRVIAEGRLAAKMSPRKLRPATTSWLAWIARGHKSPPNITSRMLRRDATMKTHRSQCVGSPQQRAPAAPSTQRPHTNQRSRAPE